MSKRLVFLAVLLLVASCSDRSQRVVVTEDDLSSQVELAVGDVLEVRLESNPSTGYGWTTTSLPDALSLQSDDYVAPDSDAVGAPGTQVVVFEAVTDGSGILRLEYVRPFDDPAVPQKVAEFIITVDGG